MNLLGNFINSIKDTKICDSLSFPIMTFKQGLGAALRRDFTHPDPPKDTCADCPVADQLFSKFSMQVKPQLHWCVKN